MSGSLWESGQWIVGEVKIWSQRARVMDDFNSRISNPIEIQISLYAPKLAGEREIPSSVL